jgi:hypothetical protein
MPPVIPTGASRSEAQRRDLFSFCLLKKRYLGFASLRSG